MDQQRLEYLLEQHRLNRLSPQEEAELDEWYEALDDPEVKPLYTDDTPEAAAYVAGHTQQIMDRIARQRSNRVLRLWMKIAAVLIAGLVITYLVWPEGKITGNRQTAAATAPAGFNRYITLPDSSTVILSEGSTLQLADGFGTDNRRLTLKGEAYFDVKHNASQPFIIQTGNIQTKVLGTAFNIKQVDDSVAVTVARGKVQVESQGKVLAVLTPGKQLKANQQMQVAALASVEVATTSAWMQEGLHFSSTTLGVAIRQLQQRYDTEIILTPGMEHCVISVVTPFSGAESLNTILDVICATLGASYTQTAKAIEIKGTPCMKE